MKFSICNEMFQSWKLDRICPYVRELGYEGIELAPFTLGPEPTRIPLAERDTIRTTIASSSLQCVGLHWLLAGTTGLHLTTHDAETRQRTALHLSELARLCADLGGDVMVFGSPQQRSFFDGSDRDTAARHAVELIQSMLPALDAYGVRLAIEPLGPEETNFINTAAEATELIRRIDSPNVKLLLDMKAMSTESVSMIELIHSNQLDLIHFHANDPNRQGPGMGAAPVRPVIQALQDADYSSWVSVEVFDFTPGPERLARESISNLHAACTIERK